MAPTHPGRGRPGRGQPILVVEDEHETAEIFRLIMERAGYVPFICHEVVTAIRYLNTQTPSAVILDLMLPDIHGLELCLMCGATSTSTTCRSSWSRRGSRGSTWWKPWKPEATCSSASRSA